MCMCEREFKGIMDIIMNIIKCDITMNDYVILTGLERYIRNIDQAKIILPRVEKICRRKPERGQYGKCARFGFLFGVSCR